MNNQDNRDTLIDEILALTYYPNRNSAMAQRKAKEVVTLAESHLKQKIRTATLDEAILAVNDEMNQTVGSKAHAIKAIDNLRGNDHD